MKRKLGRPLSQILSLILIFDFTLPGFELDLDFTETINLKMIYADLKTITATIDDPRSPVSNTG